MYIFLAEDATISALKEQFLTQGEVREKFGVVTNFYSLSHQELMKQSEALGNTLSFGGQYDIDRGELAWDLKCSWFAILFLSLLLTFKHL